MSNLKLRLAPLAGALLVGIAEIALFPTSSHSQLFGGSSGSSNAPPAAKPSAPAVKTLEKAPAAAPAASQAAPAASQAAAELQTVGQLQKAGVKRCLNMAKVFGQATLSGTSEYAAASTWHSQSPDNHFSVSLIGQSYRQGDKPTGNSVSGVFSAPTPDGKCDGASVQVIPVIESCAIMQSKVLEKGKELGNLAGVPILQNATKGQVLLIPGAANSCVVVSLNTLYAE